MASSRTPGTTDSLSEFQQIVDGTLCKTASPLPGPLRLIAYSAQPHTMIYCGLWSETERKAFWRGFTDRGSEIGDDFLAMWEWLKDAVGAGDQDGDFGKAWEAFGQGLLSIFELAGKLLVVARIPWIAGFHPKREQYQEELKELGIAITDDIIEGYQKAYNQGGIPQCTGRLLADVLAIALEIIGTKGAGKVAKISAKLPPLLKSKVDVLKTSSVSRRLSTLKYRIKKALEHTDPNIRLEGEVAQKYIDDIVEFQKHRYPDNHPVTGAPKSVPHPNKPGKELVNIEIDLELRNSIIEVTTGKNNKFGQLEKSINTLRGNPTNKNIIVFNPEHKYTATQISQLKSIPKVFVAQSWSELDKLIKQLGR